MLEKMLRVSWILVGLAGSLGAAEFDHTAWDRILKSSVNDIGEVDYAKLKANPQALNAYVAKLGETSPVNQPALFPTKAHELAYYINAYNALTTWGVVKAYPTKSVRDLGGIIPYAFFLNRDYVLGGQKMSLRALENDIIRKQYKEPRIHFAIVCASLSCPKLSREAFTAANLEEQLTFLTRQYFGETRNLGIDKAKNEVWLPMVLDWFKDDFPLPPLEYARKHTSTEKQKALEGLKNPRVKFRGYDWAINDPGSRARAKTPEERELAK